MQDTNYPLKCLVLSDGMLFEDKDANRYYSFDTFPKFVSIFASFFERTTFCVPLSGKHVKDIFSLYGKDLVDLDIIGTHPYFTKLDFYKKLPVILVKNGIVFNKILKEVDVVFMRLPCQNSFLMTLLARLRKKPLVAYFMGDEEEIVRQGHKYRGIGESIAIAFSKFHKILYRLITKRTVVSFFLSEDLRRKYGHLRENEYLIFSSLIDEHEIIPREDTCRNEPIEIIYVGRLAHEKGIRYLVYAIDELKKSKLNVCLKICGEGPEKKELVSLCESLNLEDEVNFMDFLTENSLREAYLESDIFVLPSLSEGTPKVLLEAMAKALPVISTDVGGVSTIIKNGENGILINPKSSEEIFRAILRIIDDLSLRRKIIKNGLLFAKDHTGKKQASRLADLISKKLIQKEELTHQG